MCSVCKACVRILQNILPTESNKRYNASQWRVLFRRDILNVTVYLGRITEVYLLYIIFFTYNIPVLSHSHQNIRMSASKHSCACICTHSLAPLPFWTRHMGLQFIKCILYFLDFNYFLILVFFFFFFHYYKPTKKYWEYCHFFILIALH